MSPAGVAARPYSSISVVKETEGMSEVAGQRPRCRRGGKRRSISGLRRQGPILTRHWVAFTSTHRPLSAVLFFLCCVSPRKRIDHKMHLCAGKLVPHLFSMRTLAGPRVAKYGTEGIRGNLLIRANKTKKRKRKI